MPDGAQRVLAVEGNSYAAVWPGLLRAPHDTGWADYSLFLREDGLLVGYLETDDLQAALDGMAATEVNARWQAEMVGYVVDLDLPPDQAFLRLDEGVPPAGPARRTHRPDNRYDHRHHRLDSGEPS